MAELEFKISAALKNIIGRDLITDDFIAVFELVKNSFDAHAKKVEITFTDNQIIIEDNGKGMSLDDIKNKWLFVAYSAKNEGTEDEEYQSNGSSKEYRDKIHTKRYYAGAKGIGRFSCDRLGQKLRLITRKLGESTVHELEVDWGKFEEKAKEEFVNIKVNHRTVANNKYPDLKKGTIIEVSGLHSSWNRNKLQQLKYSLEKLINPFSSIEDKKQDFAISINCPRELEDDKKEEYTRNKVNGAVKNFIFETLNVSTTQIKTTINKTIIETILIDRGTPIYHIREPNKSFKLLEDAQFHFFFLNFAAKNNFTRQMGFQPVQFGSVFLFKNGFRVYPFGDTGDDSLGMDYRKQQGYARFLGTRDLLGRIELFTDNTEEFKEVSSRDGGLVQTKGYKQLIDSFYEKCLKRLERYVVDVQWAYKVDENLKADKESEDISVIAGSIGGRSQLVDVLRKLADSKDVEILSYNKDLINIINEKVDAVPPEVFKDLIKIAEKTGDDNFKGEISSAEKRYHKLLKEKEEAERRAALAEEKRLKAEEEARIAEEKAKKAEEARERAELVAKEKELKRREEEIKRKEAEQKAREADEKREEAESSLKTEKDKNRYFQATRKTISEDAEQLVHSIKITATGIEDSLDSLKTQAKDNKKLLGDIERIEYHISKILKISNIITKSSFRLQDEVQKVDVPTYIREYIGTYSYAYKGKINISTEGNVEFTTKLSLLDVSIILDNLISNSVKNGAKQILVEFSCPSKNKLFIDFSDDGHGVPEEYQKRTSEIFKLGVTSTKSGSGIGLYTIDTIMKDKKYGKIEFLGNGEKLKGASFRLTFD